jgi:hypothetical protein
MRLEFAVAFAASMLLLSGCLAKPLSAGGAGVALVEGAPVGCERLGEVVGRSGGGMRGDLTSPHDLDLGARNDLRNRAARLGADTVEVVRLEGIVTHSFAGNGRPSAVQATGVAWRCGGRHALVSGTRRAF